ncbi:MAG: serine--tRNA ligase, partial [Clostridia bacterium]
MLDINRIRSGPGEVSSALAKRGVEIDFKELLSWDDSRRKLIFESEQMKAERNTVSAEVPRLKKEGGDVSGTLARMKLLSDEIKERENVVSGIEDRIKSFMEVLPNIPDEDVAPGDASCNEVVREWGTRPDFKFKIKNHIDICESLGLIDYKRGTKISGNGFWLYKGDGAVLEWALLNYFIEEHLKDGYEFLLPPHILNYECGYTAGQFPKFGDDVFSLAGGTNDEGAQFLLPTSETALINVHRNEVLAESE